MSDKIRISLTRDEVGILRNTFSAYLEGYPEDGDSPEDVIQLIERITRTAERHWRIRYRTVYR